MLVFLSHNGRFPTRLNNKEMSLIVAIDIRREVPRKLFNIAMKLNLVYGDLMELLTAAATLKNTYHQ